MAASARIDELRRKYEENPRRFFAPLANEYRKAGDLETAIAICQRQLATFPEHISGHIVLGQALYEAARHPEARAVFEAALAIDPENLIALRHLGDIARVAGDEQAARHWYKRILEADPRNDDIAAQLASLASGTESSAQPGGFTPAFGAALDRAMHAPPSEVPANWSVVEPTAAPEPQPAPPEHELLDFNPETFEPVSFASLDTPAAPGVEAREESDADPGAAAQELDASSEGVAGPARADVPGFVDGWELPTLDPFAEPEAPEPDAAADAEGEPTPLAEEALVPDPEPLAPAVGLDVPPPVDSGQVQLGAADLGSARLPAAEEWASDLGAHDPIAEAGAAAEPGSLAESEPATVGGPPTAPLEAEPGLEATPEPSWLAEETPEEEEAAEEVPTAAEPLVGFTGVGVPPEPEPPPSPAAPPAAVSDDARVEPAELTALAAGAFATETLAELFVQQGHLAQAEAVYARLAADHPEDAALAARLASVRALAHGGAAPAAPVDDDAPQATAEWAVHAEPEIDVAELAPDDEEPAVVADATTVVPDDTAGGFFRALAERAAAAEAEGEAEGGDEPEAVATPSPPAGAVVWAEPEPAAEAPSGVEGEPAFEPVFETPFEPAGPRGAGVAGPDLAAEGILAPRQVTDADDRAAATLAAAFSGAGALASPSLRDELALGVVAAQHPEATEPSTAPATDDVSFDRFFAGFEDLLHRPPAAVPAADARPLLEEVDAIEVDAIDAVPAGRESGADAALPAAAGGQGTASARGVASPAGSDDDLAEFNAWLRGLGEL